ncbi:inosine/guanosine kinase [Algicola sagamiensis]|uniref:inosine/guanosine kinase n=1 Tax=Algicola sagamiensis TaxID=163869 RepID=UPI00038101F0|nr:inosine/guanosine kinase [Algicola sagamiensis]
MKFPGQRKHKHYFPVDQKHPLTNKISEDVVYKHPYIVGIDQILVDITARVGTEFIEDFALEKGMSQVIDNDKAEALYQALMANGLIEHQFAGGTVGNTLHNYSVLADDRSVLLGVMSENIQIGSYAYRYLCNTSSRVDLDHLQPVAGPVGRCFTLITEEGERTFAINAGLMNRLTEEFVDENLIKDASALVISAYLMRGSEEDTIAEATMKAVKYANEVGVPVVLTLGTKFFIEQDPQWWRDFINEHVTILAMNEEEGEALTGESETLIAADKALEWVDLVLCTAGPVGLYTAGYTDDQYKRETEHALLPTPIPEFNRYEFSRPMRKADCENPIKIYSHIAPYMGGPDEIKNTNGAGDGALSALLHDISANVFHAENVPDSSKHRQHALSYSSFSQICKYANRVSYEVLVQHSPRLSRGLPEREENLEESYWDR